MSRAKETATNEVRKLRAFAIANTKRIKVGLHEVSASSEHDGRATLVLKSTSLVGPKEEPRTSIERRLGLMKSVEEVTS